MDRGGAEQGRGVEATPFPKERKGVEGVVSLLGLTGDARTGVLGKRFAVLRERSGCGKKKAVIEFLSP